MKHFSFLLGSGFSIPAGFPKTEAINEKLHKIKASEIIVHSSMVAGFIKEGEKIDEGIKKNEKLFMDAFIKFYDGEQLKGSKFQYEDFFDFYYGLMDGSEPSPAFDTFCGNFRAANNDSRSNFNLLLHFHIVFSQLLAEQLTLGEDTWSYKYEGFKDFLMSLKTKFSVHLHTLNHDLLVEYLAQYYISCELADGFEELGSPYYEERWCGEPRRKYMVRLKRFVNKFESAICLYKLHGSIDQYIYHLKDRRQAIKSFLSGGVPEFFMEFKNADGVLEYHDDTMNYYPDFLSGRKRKISRYADKHYYESVFKHFMENLKNSEHLVVIGYGFKDDEINKYVENFLSRKNTLMLIIDKNKPTEFLGYGNVKLIQKEIENVSKANIEQELGL